MLVCGVWVQKLISLFGDVSSNVFTGFLVVDPAIAAFLISSCGCMIAVSASWMQFLGTAVSLSTWSLIHYSIRWLHKKCISHPFSAKRFFLDLKLRNAPNAQTNCASKLLLPWFAWWHRCVDGLVDLLYLAAESGEWFFSKHWAMYLVLTLLLGEMLDDARSGPHGGMLHLLCQGWYVWSSWTKRNLRFDYHFIGSSNAKHIT